LLQRLEWTTPEHVVKIDGIEYARIYANPFYQVETEYILQTIEAEAQASGDVIIMDAPVATMRRQAEGLPLIVLSASARDDYVRTRLSHASTLGRCFWLVTYPDADADSTLHESVLAHLDQNARVTRRLQVGDVQVVSYQLNDRSCFLPASGYTMPYRLGQHLVLEGYSLSQSFLDPGDLLSVRLYWRCRDPVASTYKVFVHLVGPDRAIFGQEDTVPQNGVYPTNVWSAGQTVLDDHVIEVAADAPPGSYALAVGLYDGETLVRLPAYNHNGRRLPDDCILLLGTGLRITPPPEPLSHGLSRTRSWRRP
jgi:hypothetical protein